MAKHNHSVEMQLEKDVAGDVTAESEAPLPELKPDSTTGEADNAETEERIGLLEQELKAAQQAKDEYYNRLLRTQADFENFRRRNRQEMEQLTTYAGEGLLIKILPVLDSLERAIDCFKENSDSCSWQEGVQLTLKQFQNILQCEGLEAIPAQDNPFDPQVHEAVCQENSVDVETPTVVAVLQKGYKYKNKLLRPALVKVAVPGTNENN